VPALARALVACGWFGINTTIGGASIFQMLQAVTGGALAAETVPWLGLSLPQLACFAVFWAMQARRFGGAGALACFGRAHNTAQPQHKRRIPLSKPGH
jgi:cytosine/uracil/thiamine/allantoin permease